MSVRGYQLFSMLGRVYKQQRWLAVLRWCDTQLLHALPHWQHYCRYMVVILRKQ